MLYFRVYDENWYVAHKPIHEMKISGGRSDSRKLNEQITASIGGELPLSQRFFLKLFFGKEKASRQAATTSPEEARRERKTPLSPRRFATCCQQAMSARSLFREEKFQEKPLGPK